MHGTVTTSRFDVGHSKQLITDSRAEWCSEKRAAVSLLPGVNQAIGPKSTSRDNTFEYSEFKGRGRYAKGSQR